MAEQQPIELDFGEWLPDLPANKNPGALLAKNCIPEATSYRHFNDLTSFSTALDGMARGSFWIRASSGVVFNFSGDDEKLYHFDGSGGWADVSKPATTYSADIWDFVNFQDRVITTDGGAGNLQYFDCGTSLTFTDLPGNPPRCKVLGVVRDFVVLGNYAIGAEVESGGIAWSGFNSTEAWTPSLATQSQRRRTRGPGGEVRRIVSGSTGIVFRENAVIVMSYIGAPNVFQFDDLTTLHGTTGGRTVAWTREKVFYHSTEGFMELDRRNLSITPIGVFKVDKYFRETAAASDIVNMQCTIDRRNTLVFWVYRTSSSQPTFNRMLVYNWSCKRWAYAEIMVEHVGEFASVGYNLDTIGAILGGNIDSASINVDSDAYSGGDLTVLAFNPSHEAGTFDGAPLDAEIDTREMQIAAGKRLFVNGCRPIVESDTAPTVQVAPLTRDRPQDNPVLGNFRATNAIGQVDMRVNARYLRYRVKVAGGFTHAKRVEYSTKQRGRR